MTAQEYRTIIDKLGLTQEQAGVWLGVSKRSGQNYALRGPTETAAKLLRLVVSQKLRPEQVK